MPNTDNLFVVLPLNSGAIDPNPSTFDQTQFLVFKLRRHTGILGGLACSHDSQRRSEFLYLAQSLYRYTIPTRLALQPEEQGVNSAGSWMSSLRESASSSIAPHRQALRDTHL